MDSLLDLGTGCGRRGPKTAANDELSPVRFLAAVGDQLKRPQLPDIDGGRQGLRGGPGSHSS